ncbi:MAG: hypothetical protein E4H37_00590 [Gemmatimonadales bacterium]|nr:MAG: hypothetical protein E4H37_00590 [Gemmatimonadales bacterium]
MTGTMVVAETASGERSTFQEQRVALDFLVANLRRNRSGATVEGLTPSAWDSVADQAAQQKLGPLAYHRLTAGLDALPIPGPVRERLRTFYAVGQLRNTLLLRDAVHVIGALQAAGVPVMVLKGLHLAVQVYSEPGLRTMSDIDIMVPERDLAKAEHVMVGLGFGPLPRPDLEEFCRRSNHLARLSRPKSVPVEVHWTIERPTSPFTIDVDALWRRAQPIALGGLEVLALSPEDLLLHLCLHTSYHHRFDRMALKGLVDIDMVVAAFEGRLDWRQVARTARDWNAESYVYSTLRLATMILETPVPKAALASLDRKMEDETIIELARQFALTPIVDLPPGFREVRASRSLPKRAASVARGIFLPRRHMRRLYGLRDGSPLVYLYYGVRVFDLLRHRGALGLQVLLHTRRVQPALFREAARKRIAAWVGTTPATPEE